MNLAKVPGFAAVTAIINLLPVGENIYEAVGRFHGNVVGRRPEVFSRY
jgi:hypothetical protein